MLPTRRGTGRVMEARGSPATRGRTTTGRTVYDLGFLGEDARVAAEAEEKEEADRIEAEAEEAARAEAEAARVEAEAARVAAEAEEAAREEVRNDRMKAAAASAAAAPQFSKEQLQVQEYMKRGSMPIPRRPPPPPPSNRGNPFLPIRQNSDLYPGMEWINSAKNVPGLPDMDPSRRWWHPPKREGEGGQRKKKSSRTRTRQKKKQRRHRRRSTRKHGK